MSASKVLWGQILVVSLVVLASVWSATEWTAWRLAFQPELGRPFSRLFGFPLYSPPVFFWWWFEFDAYAPKIFAKGAFIAAGGSLQSVIAAMAMSIWRARETHRATTYGSANWANRKAIGAAGLLGRDGVVLGQWRRRYLRHDGPEHVLCFAPTRSGKGVGLVIPSLLTWGGSAIVHDIKGENFELTAGFRASFTRVLKFDPTDLSSAAYNPLLEVRKGACEVRDVQNIADILVDPEGMLERRSHWDKTAHALLVGAILHILYAEGDKTLAGLAHFLSDPRRPILSTLRAMLTTPHLGPGRPHPVVASAARELLNKSENERSGVISTALSFLELYRDPVVAEVTRRCDWRICDLVSAERPISLYLVVPPSDISRTKPLIRLILNQIGRRLTEPQAARSRRHRLLMMLDEFPALGRLDFFETTLAFMAGYGIKAFLIAQSLNQIEKAYGTNNAILDNCHVRVAFATNDERTAKRISDALGAATEIRAMKNYAGHRLSPWLGHLMVSRQETARPLLTPGEIMQLPPGEEIVMVSGSAPIRANKVRYFQDPQLKTRVLPPPEAEGKPTSTGKDDWTGAEPIIPPPAALVEVSPSASKDKRASPEDLHDGRSREAGVVERDEVDDTEQLPEPADEFVFPDRRARGVDDEETQRLRRVHQRQLGVSRQAALDRGDGLDLDMDGP